MFETLAEQFLFAAQIRAGPMWRMRAVLTGGRSRQPLMAGDLADVGVVNNEFGFGDAHRQQFTDALPGNGIEVLQITDVAFRIHGAIDDFGRVVGFLGKRQ